MGANELDPGMGFRVADLYACKSLCEETNGCDGVIIKVGADVDEMAQQDGEITCFPRGALNVGRCQRDPHYTLLLRPPSQDQCHWECARNVLPELPLLTSTNRAQYPRWHAYIERVYHQRLEGDATLDANLFSLLYKGDLADSLFAADGCLDICELESWPHRKPVYNGSPFIGDAGPEHSIGDFGFFVHRPFITADVAQACRRLEVMHVRTDWLDGERGVSWFFHAVGSGVFLDCEHLPAPGRIEVHRNRQSFVNTYGGSWSGADDSLAGGRMGAYGIAMLIFTAADFTVFGTDGTNPSTEIIVRHANPDSNEISSERHSCLDAPEIGIRLWTGVNGTTPCACDVELNRVNCELTPPAT